MKRLPDYEEPVVLSVPHLNLEDIGRTTLSAEGFLTFVFNETFAPAAPGKKKMIVFDEWNRYDNDSVGNFLMAITNERRIAGVKIHDSIRFMATQNPSSQDYSGTRPCTDLAETRRLNPVHMIFSPDRFLQYAQGAFTPELSVFLTQHPESALIPGKLNCPRQWERFDKDVLQRVNIGQMERGTLRLAATCYMEAATVRLFMDFIDKRTEKMVTFKDLSKDPDKAAKRLTALMAANRQDLIMATAQDIKTGLATTDKPTPQQMEGFKIFCLTVQKSVAYAVMRDLDGKSKSYQHMVVFITNDAELLAIINSANV
jgi:hypothetical protein